MRRLWRNNQGQALPIVVLFLGVLLGAIAMAIDVGKIYALRNQTSTATSAAALAAAQVLCNQLDTAIAQDPSAYNTTGALRGLVTGALSGSTETSAIAAAAAVYHTNMQGSIPHASPGTHSNPIVHMVLVPTTASVNPGQVRVTVAANVNTGLALGSVIGVPTATSDTVSATAVGLQTQVAFDALLPLMVPDQPGSSSPASKPSSPNAWLSSFIPGQTSLFLVRGAAHEVPPPPVEAPAGTVSVAFRDLYGAGNFGKLLPLTGDPYVTIGQQLETGGVPGSAHWRPPVAQGETVIMPVGYSLDTNGNNGQDPVPVLGFVTAKVDYVTTSSTGSKAGFVVTILNVSAVTTATTLQGIGSSSTPVAPTFGYALVP